MAQNIKRAHCAVLRPDHFKFASYGPDRYTLFIFSGTMCAAMTSSNHWKFLVVV